MQSLIVVNKTANELVKKITNKYEIYVFVRYNVFKLFMHINRYTNRRKKNSTDAHPHTIFK